MIVILRVSSGRRGQETSGNEVHRYNTSGSVAVNGKAGPVLPPGLRYDSDIMDWEEACYATV